MTLKSVFMTISEARLADYRVHLLCSTYNIVDLRSLTLSQTSDRARLGAAYTLQEPCSTGFGARQGQHQEAERRPHRTSACSSE